MFYKNKNNTQTYYMKMERTAIFFMANLGSEVSQIFSYIEKGELKLAQSARSRADRIIDTLLARPDLQGRTKEIEIVGDIIRDVFLERRRFEINKTEIENYFLPFALKVLSKK